MALMLYESNAVKGIANAIRRKNGLSVLYNIGEMESAIDAIPTGGDTPDAEAKDINFYDVYGKLLYSYTKAEGMMMPKLPPLPNKPLNNVPMIYDWGVTLGDVVNAAMGNNIPYNICVNAIPTDNKTHIHIRLTEEYKSPRICLTVYSNAIVTIDWGDGSTPTSITGVTGVRVTEPHNYATGGEYDIAISVNASGANIISSGSSTNGNKLLCSTSNGYDEGNHYSESVYAIEMGANLKIGNYAFRNFTNLKHITLQKGIGSITTAYSFSYSGIEGLTIPSGLGFTGGSTFSYSPDFKKIGIPSTLTALPNSFLGYTGVKEVVVPKSITTIGTSCFGYCYNLTKINLPSGITALPNSCFAYDYVLPSIDIPAGVTSLGTSVFSACNSLSEIKFRRATPATAGSSAFGNIAATAKIYVPTGTSLGYKATTNYPNLATQTYIEYDV